MITPDDLSPGAILLYGIKPCSNSQKVIFEFAEVLVLGTSPLAILNRSDPRFGKSKPTRAWLPVEIEDAMALLPQAKKFIQLVDEDQEPVQVGFVNPLVDGNEMHIQVTETTGSELADELAECPSKSREKEIMYLLDNCDKEAKRAGTDGQYLLHEGSPIFREKSIVFGEPHHRLLPYNGVADEVEGITVGVELAEPVVEAQES